MDWAGTTKSFSRDHIWEPAQLAVAGVAAAVCLTCVVAAARRSRAGASRRQVEGRLVPPVTDEDKHEDEYHYDAFAAWLGAGAFVSACFVVSWGAGVLDATFFHPARPAFDDAYFVVFTAASFAIVLVGYWFVWPIGTVAYGREWGWHCILFGIVDGLAESQLFLCIWSAAELIGLPRYGTGLITFVLQGGFKANWDQRYWNVYVAPAHNI